MKNIKSFNEMRNSNIHTGIELTPRQINYIRDGIDKEYLDDFEIIVDDGIFYIKLKYFGKFEFDRIQDLRDFIHLRYYIYNRKPYKALEIIEKNKNLDYSFSNNWLIIQASRYGYTEIVKLLLQDDRVDPSDLDNSAIAYATKNGHTEVVKILLKDKRVDSNDINNLAIIMASENGHIEVVKLLLQDDRVDPSVDNNMAVKMAIKNGHTEVVKLLIEYPEVRSSLTRKQRQKYGEKGWFKWW